MLLQRTHDLASQFLETLAARPVASPVDFACLVERAGGPLPVAGEDPASIIEKMACTMDPGLVATAGPRYFGFVIGGALPAALAADWLTSAWDQNGFCFATSPAAAAAEEISARWLIELFGLRRSASVGFTTGCTMANFTALAAARHALYRQLGWDVERQGLIGAPTITVITSEESHVSIFAALQMLGMGRERVVKVASDAQGRMRADELRLALAEVNTPFMVCAQAGNVNTGAFDPILEIAGCVHARDGWLHVDGAFGLWAAASPAHRELTLGIDLADSIAVDGHKWLNVPYDSGIVFVRDRAAHYAAMSLSAPYYAPHAGEEAQRRQSVVRDEKMTRDNHNWVPEASRRSRGFAIYAALRSLGRDGIAQMIDRNCALARRMADRLRAAEGVHILNDVVLNQVLVQFDDGRDADAFTPDVIARVQKDGTCWLGGTTWHGMDAMRISVSNWSTTEHDIDISADAILRCAKNR